MKEVWIHEYTSVTITRSCTQPQTRSPRKARKTFKTLCAFTFCVEHKNRERIFLCWYSYECVSHTALLGKAKIDAPSKAKRVLIGGKMFWCLVRHLRRLYKRKVRSCEWQIKELRKCSEMWLAEKKKKWIIQMKYVTRHVLILK